MRDYVPPSFLADDFNCPHCNAWTQQLWFHMTHARYGNLGAGMGGISGFYLAICQKNGCKKISIWISDDGANGQVIYPGETTAPLPIEHMPENVSQIYEEARQIFDKSPRAAAGLLRLAIQLLIPHLGEKEGNLNLAIGNLVKKGLSEIIQQALDSLRVIGNNAVHPGEIDVNDDRDTALALFEILNTIVDRIIIQEKRINEVYEKLPPSVKEQIKRRDSKATEDKT